MEWYHYTLIVLGGLAFTLLYAHLVHRIYRGTVHDLVQQCGELRYELMLVNGQLEEVRKLFGLEYIDCLGNVCDEECDLGDLEPLLRKRLRELLEQ